MSEAFVLVFSINSHYFLSLFCFVWNQKRIEILSIYCTNSNGEFVDCKGTTEILPGWFGSQQQEMLPLAELGSDTARTGAQPELSLPLPMPLCSRDRRQSIVLKMNTVPSRGVKALSLSYTNKQTDTNTCILTLTHIPKLIRVASLY